MKNLMTGLLNPAFEIYEYEVGIAPVALVPGDRYWLSIYNDTSADAAVDWFFSKSSFVGDIHVSPPGAGTWVAASTISSANDGELAFALTVPEPVAFVYALLGLLGIAALRQRQSNRRI